MENKTEFKDLKATVDLMPKTPIIRVSGAVILYPEVQDVHLEKAELQGINKMELLLELKYKINSQRMKGISYPLDYSEALTVKDEYTSVKILHANGDSESFPVEFING